MKFIIIKAGVFGSLLILGILAFKYFTFSTELEKEDNHYQKYVNQHYKVFALEIPDSLLFLGEKVPLEMEDIKERYDRELLVNAYWQSQTLLFYKRANKFFPIIEPILKEKGIHMESDFAIEHVDNDKKEIVDYEDRRIPFDLLVTIPTNMGDEVIAKSGLGDDLNFIPTDHNTLQSKAHENIFVIGDATNVPASKAGSVAHFEAETLTDNILLYIDGYPLKQEITKPYLLILTTLQNQFTVIFLSQKLAL